MAQPLNQVTPIDTILPPAEMEFLRRNVPHLVEFMRGQTTLITQLSIRTGGSGSGSGVTDLSGLTADVAELDEIADPSSPALFHAEHALNAADQAMIIASEAGLHGQISDLKSRMDQIEYSATDLQLLAQIADLKSRIEALENGSNA